MAPPPVAVRVNGSMKVFLVVILTQALAGRPQILVGGLT